jgi:phosphatidate cytidylyltransferase
MNMDRHTLWLFGGLTGLLTVASAIGYSLRAKVRSDSGRKIVENLISRTNAWWVMAAVFGVALLIGGIAPIVMFALTSFLALREFITLTPTRPGDHRALFWAFFLILPLHYVVLAWQWYGLFVVLIPIYAFLFIPMRTALAGDTERFLERTSKIQWGLMVCVYFISCAPALLLLRIPGYSLEEPARNAKLLFFLVFVTQISDVMQYVWGKLCGRRPIAPKVSPNKTVEGFLGGGLTATALGTALWWCTPFKPLESAAISAAIVIMGFFGGLVMSAIKRDRGVKDYGEMIPGHGGVMDRIDSLCFAAPVFFHITRYFYT